MKYALPRLIAAGMLLWAMADHPYGYYQMLRWVVCGVAGYSAYVAYERKQNVWTWIFGVMAVLFNPIAPIYLERETWQVLDLIAAALMLASFYWLRPTRQAQLH